MNPSPHPTASWLQEAIGDWISSPLIWLFIACLVGVLFCVIFLFRSSNFRMQKMTCQQGSTTLEFVLIIPMLLFCALTLAQTTLVMGGNIFVHYAAFAATRRAITTVPMVDVNSPNSESRNYVLLPDGWKAEYIRQAAVFALLPVAGRLQDSPTSTSQALVEGFRSYYTALNQTPPKWIDGFLAQRLAYANAHTSITLSRAVTQSETDLQWIELKEGFHQFGPREPITVQVEHQLHLAVPYVWPMFADSTDAKHTLVKAFYTLNNEGIDTELPPSPRQPMDFSDPLPRSN